MDERKREVDDILHKYGLYSCCIALFLSLVRWNPHMAPPPREALFVLLGLGLASGILVVSAAEDAALC
jgi:hypothetical protein